MDLFSRLETARRADQPAIDTTFKTVRRVRLDAHSWVEHVPAWFGPHEQLTSDLLRVADWKQHDRWMFNRMVREPRLTATYPMLRDAPLLTLHNIAAALSMHYGVPYDGLWLNQYRDHHDSTSWHVDWPSCKRDECIVPVLSLGATRRFLMKPRAGGRSISFEPHAGDLIVMGGRSQKDWLHSVPKQSKPAGLRLSVNFMSTIQATPEHAANR
jgi:alkylated DNA repair dioxygenase AlkB